MVKCIFFDVDGTLLSHTLKDVPESTKIALQCLEKKGIKRILATGRHKKEIENLPVGTIDFDAYVTMNAQLCYTRNGEVFYENYIQDAKRIVEIFELKEIPLMIVEEERLYINFINEDVVDAQNSISTPLPPIGEYYGGKIYMAVAFLPKEKEHILKEILQDVTITRWTEKAVDIVPLGGSKLIGIQEYLKKYNIAIEEVMAFGDGENDMEMLKYVGYGIAMGNAEDEVKEIADYVTADIDEDGIMRGLEHFGVFEPGSEAISFN